MKFRFQISEKTELCELREKIFTRDLQHGGRSTVKRGSHRTAQVMLSVVNSYMAGRIVVVESSVIFLIIVIA